MSLALACLLAYVIGGIPFGLVLARVFAGVDIRTIGSGNVGATNAARAFKGRKSLAMFLLIYVLDFAKGFVPTHCFAGWWQIDVAGAPLLLGVCAIAGHCFSPFLRLRGGKGVATGCGVFAALEPLALGIALVAFLATYLLTRKVFLGSLVIGVTLAVAVIARDPASAFGARLWVTVLAIAIAVFFFWTHRSNIKQALAGGARA